MTFSSIRNAKTGDVVGLLIEQDSGGIVAAALSGEPEDSDGARRVVGSILSSGVVRIEEKAGSSVRFRDVRPAESGYAAAVCRKVGYPLMPGASGRVTVVGTPHEMIERVWNALGGQGAAPMVDVHRLAGE